MKEIAKRLIDVGVIRLKTDRSTPEASEEKCLFKSNFHKAYNDFGTSTCIESALESLVEELCKTFVFNDDFAIVCTSITVAGWGYCVAQNRSQTKFSYVLNSVKKLTFSGYSPRKRDKVVVLTDCVMSDYSVCNMVTAMRREGIIVIGVVAIVCAGNKKMKNIFSAAHIRVMTATDLDELRNVAKQR